MENGLCYQCGGNASGPKTEAGKRISSQNARKHGIFAASRTDLEMEMLDDVVGSIGTLEAEIVDVKFQIRRVAITIREHYEGEWDGMTTERQTTRRSKAAMIAPQDGDGNAVGAERPTGGEFETSTEKRAADLYERYDRLMNRLQRLEQTRYILNGGGLGVSDPYEAARLVKQSLREMATKTRAQSKRAAEKAAKPKRKLVASRRKKGGAI